MDENNQYNSQSGPQSAPIDPNINVPSEAPIPEPQSEQNAANLPPEQLVAEPVSVEPAQNEPQTAINMPTSKPKKSKAWIIILVLVLLLAGCAVVFVMLFANDPKQDALTASTKFVDTIKAISSPEQSSADIVNKNLKIDGSVKYDFAAIDDGETTSKNSLNSTFVAEFADSGNAKINLDLGINSENNSSYFTPNNINISLNGQGISIQKDGQYIKLDGLKEIYDNYISNSFGSSDIMGLDLDYYMGEIDNQWYKVDLKELADTNQLTPQSIDYSCIEKQVESKLPEIVNLNDLGGVISLVVYEGQEQKAENGTLYTISINNEQLYNLIKQYAKQYYDFIYKDLPKVCEMGDIDDYSSDAVDELFEDFTQEDLEEIMANLPEIFVEIDKSKNISRVFFDIIDEHGDEDYRTKATISVELKLSYPDSIEIAAPENSEPLMNLIEEISNDIQEYYQSYYANLYSSLCDGLDEETKELYAEYCSAE